MEHRVAFTGLVLAMLTSGLAVRLQLNYFKI